MIVAFALILYSQEPRIIAQESADAQSTQIVSAISTFFAAAHDDDLTKFHSVVAPGFYVFDNGARFDGEALMALVRQMHAAGKRFEWNVTEPDVHISGDTAWIAYVNQGSIADDSGKKEQRWLESAFLSKRAGRWEIMFIHSTRVPAPTAELKTPPR